MSAHVLHISDLHRDADSLITTDSLLESLRLDRERYSCEGLAAPDIAVVSGDIVYGVSTVGPGADAALERQYAEASHFLVSLADLFFGGDRERVVLTPGNHDVSHPHVLRSTQETAIPIDAQQRAIVAGQLRSEGSPWRWAEKEFALRRIADPDEYAKRLAPFATFYSGFYNGKRSFSLEPSAQFGVHVFPAIRVVVAALSSCYDNDMFSRSGRIHPDCVAGATKAVSQFIKRGYTAIATWHHSLSGGPHESDYIDVDVLQSLIDGGFSVGLHGHQHRPQLLEHRFTPDRQRAIRVISAGTLCGGPRSLPPGRMRAYNVVFVDGEKRKGALHVRDMKNSTFSLPVWGAAHLADFSGSSMEFDLSAGVQSISIDEEIGEGGRLLASGDAALAFTFVREYPQHPLARRVAVEALLQLRDWKEIVAFCSASESPAEFIALAEAFYELGERAKLRALVESTAVTTSTDAGIRQSVELARNRLGGR